MKSCFWCGTSTDQLSLIFVWDKWIQAYVQHNVCDCCAPKAKKAYERRNRR